MNPIKCFLFLVFNLLLCNNIWAQSDMLPSTNVLRSYSVNEQGEDIVLSFVFDQAISEYKNFSIKEKNQKIIDFFNVSYAKDNEKQNIDKLGLKAIDIVKVEPRVRVILYLKENYTSNIKVDVNRLNVIISAEPKSIKQKKIELQDVVVAPITVDPTGQKVLTATMVFSNDLFNIVEEKQQDGLMLQVKNGIVKEELQNKIKTILPQTSIVENIQCIRNLSGTLIKFKITGAFTYSAERLDNRFMLKILPVRSNYANNDSNKMKSESLVVEKNLEEKGDKKISLNFQKIEIRTLLQLLADFAEKNIIISDTVSGDISLRLTSIPWEQALDIVLTTKNLAKKEIGGVLLIAPEEEISSRETRELKQRKQIEELAALQSELIQVNYANANDFAKLLKDQENVILSSRGQVSVDARTNALLVKDIPERITEIKKLIKSLDTPVKQVVIEAKIVRVNQDFERNLGVRFGVTRPDHISGTLEGASELARGTSPASVDVTKRLNVDLGGAFADGTKSSGVGLALARLGGDVLLDLELKALESEGNGTLISTPHIITMDRHMATIESGEDIPYNESTSSGAAALAYRKAVLKLEVTPSLTPDNKIILLLAMNNDSVGTKQTNQGISIKTEALQSQILVNNGETIVLGGIYKQTDNDKVVRVPLLGKIPLLGKLFSNTYKQHQQSELLVFLTPKIISAESANYVTISKKMKK